MRLACLKNESLYQEAKSYLEHNVNSLITSVWIGLHTTSSSAPYVYVWEDGEEATYFKWNSSPLEPNQQNSEQCIRLYKDSLRFGTYGCSEKKQFLCEDLVTDGEWSGWITWSACSAICGNGIQSRNRSCNSPPPSNGGADCMGADKEDKLCNLQICAVNGSWSMWNEWSVCAPMQCVTNRTRSRSCDSPPPSHGGNNCEGKDQERESCEHLICPLEERLTCTQLSENSFTLPELEEKIQEISKTLAVNRTNLSSEIRKKTCAEDPRPSSKYIGVVA
ncbi:properdin-like [Ostrea edulis]|uniref:properdin-like n=1 Tax=Ostrea edulis TaxID=37623 RepID=UPI0024AF9614|nr:properdin-like [Ostrea edulis]